MSSIEHIFFGLNHTLHNEIQLNENSLLYNIYVRTGSTIQTLLARETSKLLHKQEPQFAISKPQKKQDVSNYLENTHILSSSYVHTNNTHANTDQNIRTTKYTLFISKLSN